MGREDPLEEDVTTHSSCRENLMDRGAWLWPMGFKESAMTEVTECARTQELGLVFDTFSRASSKNTELHVACDAHRSTGSTKGSVVTMSPA